MVIQIAVILALISLLVPFVSRSISGHGEAQSRVVRLAEGDLERHDDELVKTAASFGS